MINQRLKSSYIVKATPAELVKASHIYTYRNGEEEFSNYLKFKSADYSGFFIVIEFSIRSKGAIKIDEVILTNDHIDKNTNIKRRLRKREPIRVITHGLLAKIINEGPIKVYRVEGFAYPLDNDNKIPRKGDRVSGKFASTSLSHQRYNIRWAISRKAKYVEDYIVKNLTLEGIPRHGRYVFAATILAEEYRPPLMSEKASHFEYSDGSEVVVEKGKYIDIRAFDSFEIGLKKGYIDKGILELLEP